MQQVKMQKNTLMSKLHRLTKYNLLSIDFMKMLISITYLYRDYHRFKTFYGESVP